MRPPAVQSKPAPTSPATTASARSRFPVWLMAALLGLATLALYWPTMRHGFINYDDDIYVTANLHVQQGLTWENLKWAFVTPVSDNWHPLTILSHMLDCQLFGLKPWGHHLSNVLLHALNTVLVFLFLRGLTGAFWRSALVAALFGWHPLHVESVAWVAERKDVLSGFFGLLTLIFYSRYAQKRLRRERREPTAKAARVLALWPLTIDYGLALIFLALGLMSKPMLVTWPFVLLLLDYWPLGRFELSTRNPQLSTLWRLVREKIPFFILAGLSSVVTYVVQQQGGAVVSGENLPLAARVGNALISYCRYLGKLCWPTDLAVFYPPYTGYWPLGEVLLAAALLAGLSVFFLGQRRYPFLLMGWLWFIGTLVPVIGLVQVGEQAMADRYSYLPSLGVLILAVWGAFELTRGWRYQVMALSLAGGAAIILCVALTRQQLEYWQDSETLFRHALAVTQNNLLAHLNLGFALEEKGQTDEAIRQFQETIRLKPDSATAYFNLGVILGKEGQTDEAIGQYQEAVRLNPGFAAAHNNLGNARFKQGQLAAALGQFQEAVRLNPGFADAHNNLGNVLFKQGQLAAAIGQYEEAVRLNPGFAEAHNNLGQAFFNQGQFDRAISEFQETIRLNPDLATAHNNLGNVLFSQGQFDEAIGQFQEAIRLNPDYAEAYCSLGLARFNQGRLDEAISQFQEAVRLKPDYAEAHNNLGSALGREGHTDEAIRQFQEAIRLKPDFAEARNNLNRALRIQNAAAGH